MIYELLTENKVINKVRFESIVTKHIIPSAEDGTEKMLKLNAFDKN